MRQRKSVEEVAQKEAAAAVANSCKRLETARAVFLERRQGQARAVGLLEDTQQMRQRGELLAQLSQEAFGAVLQAIAVESKAKTLAHEKNKLRLEESPTPSSEEAEETPEDDAAQARAICAASSEQATQQLEQAKKAADDAAAAAAAAVDNETLRIELAAVKDVHKTEMREVMATAKLEHANSLQALFNEKTQHETDKRRLEEADAALLLAQAAVGEAATERKILLVGVTMSQPWGAPERRAEALDEEDNGGSATALAHVALAHLVQTV